MDKRITTIHISTILRAFGIHEEPTCITELTNGNINGTFRIEMPTGHGYILQSVNTDIFKDPYSMMRNIDLVTGHIRNSIIAEGLDPSRATLNFHHTKEGALLFPHESRLYRLADYIHDSMAFNGKADSSVLSKAGEGFGRFEAQLEDLDARLLSETIPNFHNTKLRIENFERTVEENPCKRLAECESVVSRILDNKKESSVLCDLVEHGELPLRVTHNDTKTNNMLFDRNTHEFLAVIDLDTVMPGLLAYDAADTIRFSANTAAEDERDISKVSLDLDLYEAFLTGFLGKTAYFMTKLEKETLVLGIQTIVYEQALRFLDDYIAGDVYYKTSRPKQNLDRARCQLALYDDMKRNESQMHSVVRRILRTTLGC